VSWGLIITLVSGWYLTGLSWVVALVIYPSFRLVPDKSWEEFHQHHSKMIAVAVTPLWAAEALGIILWALSDYSSHLLAIIITGAAALGTVLFTVFGAVPAHQAFQTGFNPELERQLTLSNWLRTAAWTIAAITPTVVLVQSW
jgi:hypothetical protein